MAWGAPKGVGDLVERVQRSDPSLKSLCILRVRKVDEAGCMQLADALAGETGPDARCRRHHQPCQPCFAARAAPAFHTTRADPSRV